MIHSRTLLGRQRHHRGELATQSLPSLSSKVEEEVTGRPETTHLESVSISGSGSLPPKFQLISIVPARNIVRLKLSNSRFNANVIGTKSSTQKRPEKGAISGLSDKIFGAATRISIKQYLRRYF